MSNWDFSELETKNYDQSVSDQIDALISENNDDNKGLFNYFSF